MTGGAELLEGSATGTPSAAEVTPAVRPTRHLVFLDGLRGVAALAVLLYHFSHPFDLPWASHGWLAVDFFFALSGFVVASAYEQRLREVMPFRRFVSLRVIRLWPMLIVGVALGLPVLAARMLQGAPDWVGLAIAAVAGLALIPIRSELDPRTAFPINPPAWSLFWEVAINLAYAALVRRLTTPIVIAVMVFSGLLMVPLGLAHGGLDNGGTIPTASLGAVRVCFSFSVGVLLWRARNRITLKLPSYVPLIALVGMFAVPNFSGDVIYQLVSILLFCPLILAVSTNIGSTPFDRVWSFIGALSYPLYLLHYPLVRVFGKLGRSLSLEGAALYGWIFLGSTISVVLAFVALKLIDEPVRAWLGARLRRVA